MAYGEFPCEWGASHPPWRFLSFLYTCIRIIWTRIREQFWSCNWAVNLCLLNCYNVRLMTTKKSHQLQLFASYVINTCIYVYKVHIFTSHPLDSIYFRKLSSILHASWAASLAILSAFPSMSWCPGHQCTFICLHTYCNSAKYSFISSVKPTLLCEMTGVNTAKIAAWQFVKSLSLISKESQSQLRTNQLTNIFVTPFRFPTLCLGELGYYEDHSNRSQHALLPVGQL